VDYGAALEMRFGATRRGFESRPLRHATWALRQLSRHSPKASAIPRRSISWQAWACTLPYPPAHSVKASTSGQAGGSPRPRRPSGAECVEIILLGMTQSTDIEWRAGGARADPSQPLMKRSLLSFPGRARRGTSGALNLQSAPAGLNSHPRSPYSNATASSDVEDRVPRSGDSRTVSGPEGSSTKRTSSGAAERPGPSRSSRRARDNGARRWVHGISSFASPGPVTVIAGAP
jgi:hypothetical protein